MVAITLPDKSIRQFERAVSVAEVAASIGAGLAKAALAGKVLKDLGYGSVYNLGAFKDWAESGGPLD